MADLLHRVKPTLIALLGAVWAEEPDNSASDTVPYPDVWCRTVPLTGQSLTPPSSLFSVYMDPKNHPIISYVLRLPGERAVIRYYDFFADQIIDEYESIKYKTPDGVDGRIRDKEIRDRHGLTDAHDVFYALNPKHDGGAYNVPSPLGAQTISYSEIPTSDGGRLRRTSSDGDIYPLSSGLQKFDAQGRELFHVMLIKMTRDRQEWGSNPENPFMDGRNYGYIHSRSIFPKIYDLQDGTYLLRGLDEPLLLRFRDALDSPCLERNAFSYSVSPKTEFLVVDAPWARNLFEKKLIQAKEDIREHKNKYQIGGTPRLERTDAYVTDVLKDLLDKGTTENR
ncbi:MAG: hypothetical protein NUV50_03620 [Rhodospirillales bacterium]|nr:hypothetical protein [Rhodospirillales bacterium]